MSFFISKFTKTNPLGLVVQSILGLILFPILFFHFIFGDDILDVKTEWGLFSYVFYLIGTLLISSVVSYKKSITHGKKCHYCEGAVEVSGYTCINPLCGKKQ